MAKQGQTGKKGHKGRQTRNSGRNLKDKFLAYQSIHGHALFSSLGRLWQNRFTALMTIGAMAIAIALATLFYVLVLNLQQLTGGLGASSQVSVFLKPDVSDQRGRELVKEMSNTPEIEEISLITKAMAMQEFREYSGFGDALKALQNNPLPAVIQLQPVDALEDSDRIQPLLDDLSRLPEVDHVQRDMQWVHRLQTIMLLAKRAVNLLSFILALAVIFIIGNTIRLELQNRKEEVVIAKLVGATDGFIQRPFVYCGLWYGFLAGWIAWLIVTVIMLILHQPIERLSSLYDGTFRLAYLGLIDTCLLILFSSMLGVAGAWVVLKFQLQQLKPE